MVRGQRMREKWSKGTKKTSFLSKITLVFVFWVIPAKWTPSVDVETPCFQIAYPSFQLLLCFSVVRNTFTNGELKPEGVHGHRGRLPGILQGPLHDPQALRDQRRQRSHPGWSYPGKVWGPRKSPLICRLTCEVDFKVIIDHRSFFKFVEKAKRISHRGFIDPLFQFCSQRPFFPSRPQALCLVSL